MNSRIIETITQLSNINSGSHHYDGCVIMLQEVTKLIHPITSDITLHQGIAIQHIQDNGAKSVLEFAPTLHAKINPNAIKRVCLFGHVDSVFEKESDFQTVTHKNNTLYGPAVSDMKGGIVIMLEAVQKFLSDTKNLNIGLDILLNSDEEVGSLSSENYFLSQCPFMTVALGYEPALPCGNFAGERKGGITFTMIAQGKSAHAGRDFENGRNAVTALSRLSVFCDNLWREYKGLSINVGQFIGGGAVNVVPDMAIMRVNMRSYSKHDMLEAILKIQEYMNKIATEYEINLEYHERNRRNPKVNFDIQVILQNYVSDLCKNDNMSSEFIPTGGMCDGNLFSGEGIPTVDSLGAIGGKIHTFDEFLNCDAIENRINLSYNLLKYLNETHCRLN
jgi:glutamate carboxypeptidase